MNINEILDRKDLSQVLLFPLEGNAVDYSSYTYSELRKVNLKDYRKIVAIVYDSEGAENPRTEWSNSGTIISFATREFSSDPNTFPLNIKVRNRDDEGQFYFEDEAIEGKFVLNHKGIIKTSEGKAYILPIYMYSHSGERISTIPFGDRWDSGLVGYIYMTEQKAKEEQLTRKDGKINWKAVKARLESEIETFDQYISSEVYGFISHNIKDGIIEEDEDSCYGFFGSDIHKNGILDHIGEEVKA